MVMRDVFPELFTRYKVSSIHQYSNKLYQSMVECIPKKTDNPHMVVLTPGIYNSAYFGTFVFSSTNGNSFGRG